MLKYKSIDFKDDFYYLNTDASPGLYGCNYFINEHEDVFIRNNGGFIFETGNFKIIWMTPGERKSITEYNKITKGHPVRVLLIKSGDDLPKNSYILVKEYENIQTIESFFEILDYYQNISNEKFVDLLFQLANSLAHFRDACGLNDEKLRIAHKMNEQIDNRRQGLMPDMSESEMNPKDKAALYYLKENVNTLNKIKLLIES
jgi:hypothetical protein